MFRIEFAAKTKADAHAALDAAAKAEAAKSEKVAEVQASNAEAKPGEETKPLPFEASDIAPAPVFAVASAAIDALPMPDGTGMRLVIEGTLTEGHGGAVNLSIRTA